MFKFDPSQALTHRPLGTNDKSSVYPYMEDLDESKWVVKCLHIKNYEELSYTSQNIQMTSTAGSASVVQIKGHDIQKDNQGDTVIYIKMPRMQNSLKDIIQQSESFNQEQISIEQIVQYYYSILGCLHELCKKGIAHRNIKPTNIFIDAEGHIYLSDLKMAQSSIDDKQANVEMRQINHEDSVYKAPETFGDNWVPTEEDLHKSDVWSLAMVIVKLCLLENFIPISPDLPIGDIKDIIEQNLVLLKQKYGEELVGVLEGALTMDINERPSFRTIQSSLQETFPYLKLWQLKDSESQISWSNEIVGLMQQDYSIDIKEISSLREKSSLIKEDLSSIEKGTILENNSIEKLSGVSKLCNSFQKGKEFVQDHKRSAIVMLFLLVLLIIGSRSMLKPTDLNKIILPRNFTDIMRGIRHKYENNFYISFSENGMLYASGIMNNLVYKHNKTSGTTSNDTMVGNLMKEISSQFESNDAHDQVRDFAFVFEGGSNISNTSLLHLENSLVKMKRLRTLSIEQINGLAVTNKALQSLFGNVSREARHLQNLTIGLFFYPEIHTAESYNIVKNALRSDRNLTAFNLLLDYPTLNDDDLQQLALDLSQNGQKLRSLNIRIQYPRSDWGSPQVSPAGLKNFNSLFLSNLINLIHLDLDFNGSPVSDDALKALATSINSFGKNLKSVGLAISNCPISDSGLKSFGSQLSKEKLKNLAMLSIQTPIMPHFSETKAFLLDQLDFISNVYIWPR